MKKRFLIQMFALLFWGVWVGSEAQAAYLELVNLGDTTVEDVMIGNAGDNTENLEYWFSSNDITNPDGSPLSPVGDQLQDELFFTPDGGSLWVEFLGIGYAGYHSPFGVFTYSGSLENFDDAYMNYLDPLFTQNEVDANSSHSFSVEPGAYFGFYLDMNGSGNKFSTLTASNTDGVDHALFFETNKGYTVAFEDMKGGGDEDYEDLVVNVGGGSSAPVPEPATVILLASGLLGVIGLGKKRQS